LTCTYWTLACLRRAFRQEACQEDNPDMCAGTCSMRMTLRAMATSVTVANRVLASHEYFHACSGYDTGRLVLAKAPLCGPLKV